ncbi:MAG: sugar nucleotide-binding protein [Spirochaetes bacterium]|nr:sugar nucleotide-binding protein [Spirochaetota bacterium]
MKVIIFGANGMMGRYAYSVLKKHYTSVPLMRDDFDIRLVSELNAALERVSVQKGDVVINCAGIINKRLPETGIKEMIYVNALFPRALSNYCVLRGSHLVHISTDCVFSGRRGRYIETDPTDAEDEYGITKLIGEPEDAMVIRTSFIGEEPGAKRSLLEWVRKQNGRVPGYVDHRWNGLTCYSLALILKEIIDGGIIWKGIRHIHSPDSLTKYELLSIINNSYNLGLEIHPVSAGYCNRTLASMHEPLFAVPGIAIQVEEQKKFLLSDLTG